MIIERAPSDPAAVITFGAGGVITNKRMPYVLFRDIAMTRAGTGAIGSFYAQRVTLDNANQSSAIHTSFYEFEGVVITNCAGSSLAGNTSVSRLLRGVYIQSGSSGSFPEPHTVVGCRSDTPMTLKPVAGRHPDRGIVAFNKFHKVDSMSFLLLGQPTTGFSFVQNLVEHTGVATGSGVVFSGDSDVGSTEHIIIWNNTITGWGVNYRCNWAYLDGSASNLHLRTHRLWSVRGNIIPSLNMKSDIFVGSNEANPTAAAAAIGNWPQRYGVGWLGNATLFIDAGPDGVQSGSNFGRDYGGLKAINGTSPTTPINMQFVNYQAMTSTTVAGAGIGNYNVGAGSPAIGVLSPSEEMLPFDLDGVARTRGAIGAYA